MLTCKTYLLKFSMTYLTFPEKKSMKRNPYLNRALDILYFVVTSLIEWFPITFLKSYFKKIINFCSIQKADEVPNGKKKKKNFPKLHHPRVTIVSILLFVTFDLLQRIPAPSKLTLYLPCYCYRTLREGGHWNLLHFILFLPPTLLSGEALVPLSQTLVHVNMLTGGEGSVPYDKQQSAQK